MKIMMRFINICMNLLYLIKRKGQAPRCDILDNRRSPIDDKYIGICFDMPNGFFNYIQCFLSGVPFSHARIIMYDELGMTAFDLNSAGIDLVSLEDWDIWEGSNALMVKVQYKHTLNLLARAIPYHTANIKWSLSYMLDYIFTGTFPSLNCCSFISLLLWYNTEKNTPALLLDKLGVSLYDIEQRFTR